MLTPIFFITVKSIINYPNSFTVRQNNIGILQLRRSLSLGIDHVVDEDSICMNFKDDEMCFELNETNLIAFPGSQFYLVNIDDLYYELDEEWIYIHFQSLNKNYTYKLIRYEKG